MMRPERDLFNGCLFLLAVLAGSAAAGVRRFRACSGVDGAKQLLGHSGDGRAEARDTARATATAVTAPSTAPCRVRSRILLQNSLYLVVTRPLKQSSGLGP